MLYIVFCHSPLTLYPKVTGMFLSNSGIIVPPLKRTSSQDTTTFDPIVDEYVEPERDGEDAGDIEEEDEVESVVFLLQDVSSMKTFILTEDIGEDLVSGVSEFEYISEDDLEDLVDQIQLDEEECKCPNCTEKIGLLRHQSFLSKTVQQLLFGFHQLAKLFLSWAGQPRTCLYLVRRDWEQRDGVSCIPHLGGALLRQDKGDIGKSIPDAQEIFREPRDSRGKS